jgi:putative ABC transport system permease protein
MRNDKHPQPPQWMDKLLALYCSAQRFEELQGDLHELYRYDQNEKGSAFAKRAYLWNVLKCLKPYAYNYKSHNEHHNKNTKDMIWKFLMLAFRRLTRQFSYSMINISGLTMGIVCFTFIYLYVSHELSFDQFHAKKDNLYTTPFTWHFGDTTLPTARATSNVGPLLQQNYPEVQRFVRLTPMSRVVKNGDVVAEENSFVFTDSTFFDMLSFELIEGNPKSALVEPKSVILTEKMAAKYFGTDWNRNSLLGTTLQIGAEDEYKITGVAKNPPSNSHIQFDFLASFSTFPEMANISGFDNSAYLTYVELVPGANVDQLRNQIIEDIKKGFNGELPVEIGLKPFNEIYLEFGMSTGVGPISNITTVYIFGGIGILIIIIACINYMNLATARSVERAKEVGVRKVMGAARTQLIGQFLGESVIITFVSVLMALALLYAFLPLFNNLAAKELDLNLLSDTQLPVFLVIIWLSVSFLAGVYPAFALSGFSVIGVLRGRFKNSSAGSMLRRVLVVFQFSISVVLIVSTIVIYKQLSFVNNKTLGYDKDLIISLPLDPQSRPQIELLKQQFEKLSDVQATSVTGQLPSQISYESTLAIKEGEENRQLMRISYIDNDYVETLGLETISGGEMSTTNTEAYEFLINESAAKFFGWTPEDAIGQRIKIWNSEWGNVVGVVKDFHFSSLHEKIKPLVLYNTEGEGFGRNNMMLRIVSDDFTATLKSIEDIWSKTVTHKPFEYAFLADKLDSSYEKEAHLSELISVFSILAIFIGCLGLFGLVSYTAYQRSKEIGIRKVLGASVGNIILILSKGFSRQIVVSLVIGITAAFFIMDMWLQSFEYKTTIGLDVILLSVIVTLGIALFTMSFKSIQAALLNPADTLRSE